ncbi:hypothetical protein CEXT_255121 [Caerostris extrusa]|uniref:Uncharacterized protein n=1 Tax=Caerostris extrusa TaxID=172846 RepID=A0AAV4VFK6_CAEEX|nr:hypothetical protein CEXT_255121 [Caerostris extrusa]
MILSDSSRLSFASSFPQGTARILSRLNESRQLFVQLSEVVSFVCDWAQIVCAVCSKAEQTVASIRQPCSVIKGVNTCGTNGFISSPQDPRIKEDLRLLKYPNPTTLLVSEIFKSITA